MRYEIKGETLPVVICNLENGERMITEGGGMSWMSPNMKMETTTNGGVGKAIGRMFSGEKMFQNIYTAQGGPGMIAFASSFPGSIKAFRISPGQEMIFQKSAFLAGEAGVNLSVFFNKKIEQDCSAEKDSLCKDCQEMGPYLQSSTDMSWNMSYSQGSRSWSIPDTWLQ